MSRNEHKRWFITILNYSGEELAKLRNYASDYMCLGLEVAPTTGTPHVHVYFEFKSGKRFDTLKKAFPRARIEAAKGNLDQCRMYCAKDGSFEEKGTPKRQGERTDLSRIAELIEEGATMREIAQADPANFIRYNRGIQALRNTLRGEKRVGRSAVIWLWGKAGTGKSYYAKSRHDDLYIKEPGNKWWDKYDNQEAVLIDDFDASDGFWASNEGYRSLLRLLDEGPCQVEIKGNFVEFNSKFIYITCEFAPDHFWTGNKLAQVTSRIGEIREMTGDYRERRELDARHVLTVNEEFRSRREFIQNLEEEEERKDDDIDPGNKRTWTDANSPDF